VHSFAAVVAPVSNSRDSAGSRKRAAKEPLLPWRRGPPSLVRPAIERRVRLLHTIHRNVGPSMLTRMGADDSC